MQITRAQMQTQYHVSQMLLTGFKLQTSACLQVARKVYIMANSRWRESLKMRIRINPWGNYVFIDPLHENSHLPFSLLDAFFCKSQRHGWQAACYLAYFHADQEEKCCIRPGHGIISSSSTSCCFPSLIGKPWGLKVSLWESAICKGTHWEGMKLTTASMSNIVEAL